MEVRKPHAALARTVRCWSRATVVVLLVGMGALLPAPSRGENPSSSTLVLFDAVERNDFSAARTAVADGARLDVRDARGMRPVDLAIEKGHYEIAHYLLSLHDVRDATGVTPAEGGRPTGTAVTLPPPGTAEQNAPAVASVAGVSSRPLPPPPTEPTTPQTLATPPFGDEAAKDQMADNDGFLAKASSRIEDAARSFERTFDTFFGGWFFRWIGRKLSPGTDPGREDGTIAVADLSMADRPLPPPAPPAPPPDDAPAGTQALPPSPVDSDQKAEANRASQVVPPPTPPEVPDAAVEERASAQPETPPVPPVQVTGSLQVSEPSSKSVTHRNRKPAKREAAHSAPSAADPFAPDAVAPGSRQPIVGDTLPTPPAGFLAENPAIEEPSENAAATPAKPAAAKRRSAPKAKDVSADREGALPSSAVDPKGLLDQFTASSDPAPRKEAPPRRYDTDEAVDVPPVHTAVVSPPPSRKAPDSVLTLGESIYITAAMPPEPADPSERSFCVKKNRGAVIFCVEPVDWPAKLARQLRVHSVMYQGAQAIVRYDEGLATRVHAIFPAEAFGVLLAHYTQRFGTPTATGERAIAPFGQPRQSNQVISWQRLDPLTHEKTTLEIRRHDDTRGGFPDLRYGAIMLYNSASPPIFPILSTLDLMPTSAN